ncbi:universal stress protein [Actinomadura sp. NTSP31]|uniref:universal stress protein n=1 Tax=Actinomadura sp. NTSP31 TaxID=1735447 RepID=UPI0035C25675
MTHVPDTDRIVVGVDGSAASLAALRWAAGQATLQHAEIVAVRAWRASRDWLAPYAVAARRPSPAQERERARNGLATDVLKTLGPLPQVPIRQELVRGGAARALIAYAGEAQLLVLGGRCDDRSAEVFVGPVASACLRHAPCPVVLVPPAPVPARAADDRGGGLRPSRPGRTAPDHVSLASADLAARSGTWRH